MQDCFGRDVSQLRNIRLFQFDLDGTVYNDGVLYPGAQDLFRQIRENGGHYAFITNNSSSSVADCLARVQRMGIPADEECFFTASSATVAYLLQHHADDLIYVMGTSSLVAEVKRAGLKVTEQVTQEAAVVLVGFDTELTSQKLRNTCEMLTYSNVYLATNPDLACPASFGFIPDCGSICQMLKNASGRQPLFIGKPAPVMVQELMNRFGCTPSETCVVGDRLYTDIAAGRNAGTVTVCVLTGEATMETIPGDPDQPDFTLPSVKELYEAIRPQ